MREVVDGLPQASLAPVGSFEVFLDGERLVIPQRIYNTEPPATSGQRAGVSQRVVDAIYTRHHDGFVRQRHVTALLPSADAWVVPFVVQLIGEYVVEIIETIQSSLPDLEIAGSPVREAYGRFVVENPAFFALTRSRVASYWNCYYRRRYPDRRDYPGFALVASLEAAARDLHGDV